MNIKIAENIKRLRKQEDLTQEELANILGVSFQAVSRWERDEGYPDITFLPTIANYFEITIDELMGMQQMKNEQNLYNVHKRNNEYIRDKEFDKAEKLLREALKTFPNEYGLLTGLAMALYFKNIESEIALESIKEAITLCERVLKGSTNEKLRSTTRVSLCLLYKSIGNDDKAIESAKTLPHFWESRELIVPALFEKLEYETKLKESIKLILSTIHEKINDIEKDNITMADINRFITLGPKSCNSNESFKIGVLDKIQSYIE